MKNLKNILTLSLVLLTGLIFGQTVMTHTVNSGGIGTGFNMTVFSYSVGLTSTTNFTISFQYQTLSTPINVTINDGTTTTTNTLVVNAPSDFSTKFSLIVNKTTLNDFVINYSSNEGLWKNLTIQYTTGGTGINNIKNIDLNVDMYSNLNTIFVKNSDNLDNVKLEVFNISGQLVMEEAEINKDSYELNVATGIYIIRLSKNDVYKSKKVFIGQ